MRQPTVFHIKWNAVQGFFATRVSCETLARPASNLAPPLLDCIVNHFQAHADHTFINNLLRPVILQVAMKPYLPVFISPLALGFLIPGDDQYRALVVQKCSGKLDQFDFLAEEHLQCSEDEWDPEEYHIVDDNEEIIQYDLAADRITDVVLPRLIISQIRDADEYDQWTSTSSEFPEKGSGEVGGSDLGFIHMYEPLLEEVRDHLAKVLDAPFTDNVITLQPLASGSEDSSEIDKLVCFRQNDGSREYMEMTLLDMLEISPIHKKLYALVTQDKDLFVLLSQKDKSITLFAPTDKAFDRLTDHVSDEELIGFIPYHISPSFYAPRDLFASRTLPTMYEVNGLIQRLRVSVELQGLTLNLHSNVKCKGADAKNGIIYTVDSVIEPPPEIREVIELFPEHSSLFLYTAYKTGLINKLKGTVFMPSNQAFFSLPRKIRNFLLSKRGEGVLKKILEYHLVPNDIAYTDALVQSNAHYHIDVQTLLKDRTISIDVFRFSRFLDVKINGENIVTLSDLMAQNGVIHTVRSVIFPPKKLNGRCGDEVEMTVECLIEAFGEDEGLSTLGIE